MYDLQRFNHFLQYRVKHCKIRVVMSRLFNQLLSLAAFMAIALLGAIALSLAVEAKATTFDPSPNAHPSGDLTPTASDNQPWQDLSSPRYFLDFAEATSLKIPQQAVNIRLPANTEGLALSTLTVRNIQVRAEWDIMDKHGFFTLRADGQKAFLQTTGVGELPAPLYEITVLVKDVFSALNSEYDDLVVSAPILIFNHISTTLWALGGLTENRSATRNAHLSSSGTGWSNILLPGNNTYSSNSALVHNGTMYMFTGTKGNSTSNDVWRTVNPVNESDWINSASSNRYSKRSSPHVVLFNDEFYLLGSSGRFIEKNDVWRSENGADWTILANGNTWPLYFGYSVAATKKWMFVVGGRSESNNNNNDIWRSNDGVNWSTTPTVPDSGGLGRVYAMAVSHVIGGTEYLYVMGGVNDNNVNYINDVWRTEEGVTWEKMTTTTIWSARGGAGIASHNGLLYVLGGDNSNGSRANYKDVWASIDGAEWFHVGNLPIKLTNFPVVSFNP